MSGLAQALCFFCAVVGSPPYPQLSQRAVGDIRYTHETPGGGVHVLRLSTTDYLVDADPYRAERLYAFAYGFAYRACYGRFSLAPAERKSWPAVAPIYAQQFVFRCR